MPNIILYLTKRDADFIRRWVNAEPEIAWIIKSNQSGNDYVWKAVYEIPEIVPQNYCLWHTSSDALSIPSGSAQIPDTPVLDPFAGWNQRLTHAAASAPWFGGNLPGPYLFSFAEVGKKVPQSIARSGLFWAGDQFRSVGKPAHENAKTWWQRLKRFVKKNSVSIPWPEANAPRTLAAYAFPDAYASMAEGVPYEVNP